MFLSASKSYLSADTLTEKEKNKELLNLMKDLEVGKTSQTEKNTDLTKLSSAQLLKPLRDLTIPYNKSIETPLFLDIPLTGSSAVKSTLSKCQSLSLACELGLQQPNYNEDTLDTFRSTREGFSAKYVNVDTSTPSGLQRAAKLDLLSQKLADVVTIPSLYDSTILFESEKTPGRMFSIFAHPTAHAVAYFHYIKRATWDVKYNPNVERMNLRQYAQSKYIENNPIVRLLTKTPGKDANRVLTKDDLEVAKKIVESKCLVGLYRDLEGSLARFDRYFGWSIGTVANNSTSPEKDEEREKKLTQVKKCRSGYMQKKGDY